MLITVPTPSHGRFVIVTQVTILSPGLIALKIKHSVGGLCSNRQDHVLKRKEMTKKKSLDDVFSIPIHLLPPHAYTYTTSGSLFLLYCKDDFPEVFLSCKDFLQAGEKKKKSRSPKEVCFIGRNPAASRHLGNLLGNVSLPWKLAH